MGFGKCPRGCGRTVLWAKTRHNKNVALETTPLAPQGQGMVVIGERAYMRAELVAAGRVDDADIPAHMVHFPICPMDAPASRRRPGRAFLPARVCVRCGVKTGNGPVGGETDGCAACE